MTEEPEDPQGWTSWYTAAKNVILKKQEERRTAAISKNLASQERINELQDAIERGQEAKRLVESDFWEKDVEPFLRSEAILKPWVPKPQDAAPSERSYIDYLVGSGQVRVLTRLLNKLEAWQIEGAAAEKTLQGDIEKRKALTQV